MNNDTELIGDALFAYALAVRLVEQETAKRSAEILAAMKKPRYVQESDDYLAIPIAHLTESSTFYVHGAKIGSTPVSIRAIEPCKTERANTHLKTSKGDWCIPLAEMVYV